MTSLRLRVALVTAEAARELDEDLPPLRAALEARGIAVDAPAWRDPQVRWSDYDVAVLRSTWDYSDRLGEFLDWAERTAAQTLLLNPAALVRWNLDKHYLAELAARQVPVIPTRYPASAATAEFPASGEFVVKPTVGAGSRGARRLHAGDFATARQHIDKLLAAGSTPMIQPYLPSVDAAGETALVYFDGVFSHAIRKGALLSLDGTSVRGLFAPEKIQPRTPAADELAVGAAALAALGTPAPLYARVDLIRAADGAPLLLELELAEPSLFFAHGPGSAARFAAAIAARGARP
jgi:glutathione synthase/RimK-type ligase-like ATP-grasp enzyme